MFGTDAWIPNYAGIILIPTFTGLKTSRNWYLTVLSTLPSDMRGFVFDSLGYSTDRMEASQRIANMLLPDVEDMRYIPSPH